MSTCLEFEGKNVEKAIEEACEKLNVSKDKLKYDVISHGSSGIFGIVGVKKARIRVSLREDVKPETHVTPDINTEIETATEVEDEPELMEVAESELPEESSEASEERVKSEDSDDEIAEGPVEISDDALEAGVVALKRISSVITGDINVSVQKYPDKIIYRIDGGNAGSLIGKRGQTLEAMQYLTEKIVNKSNQKRIRILVDIEGYLEKRENNLRSLAERMAEKAKRTGKPISVGQLSAQDRRVVHLALKDNPAVRTQSMGEGTYRKLIVFPKKQASKKKQN